MAGRRQHQEWVILQRRWFLAPEVTPARQADVAAELGVSPGRVSQIEQRLLTWLRHPRHRRTAIGIAYQWPRLQQAILGGDRYMTWEQFMASVDA